MLLYCGGNADVFCKHILRIFDCDGNDYLDFKEFLMAMDIARCDSGKEVSLNIVLF
jgi:Ca2+-binding EF-hand superfamily protein